MKKNTVLVLLAVTALLLASLACNAVTGGGGQGGDQSQSQDQNQGSNDNGVDFSFSTANITNAHMSSDESDSAQVTSYTTDAPSFYCYFDLNNAPDDTVIKGVWTLISADGYDSNQEIDSAELTGGDNTYYFSLGGGTEPWPVGQFKIDLYINGNLVQTLNFEVK